MPTYNPILIVGLGGIGSHLAEPLARYLAVMSEPPTLVLIDGDSYTRGNLSRQRVSARDIGTNKAASQSRRLAAEFPSLRITPRESYVDERNVRNLVIEKSCVFSCVDNHATRKLLSDSVLGLRTGLLLSAGNDLTDGNMQVFQRRNGRNISPPLDAYHDEIRNPQDVNPAHLSCEELAHQPQSAQVIMANFTAAALLLNAFYALTRVEQLPYAEVYFDINKNAANPRPRS
jgi:molybdopterin/thiamine biosynthesis adenylyltransferase